MWIANEASLEQSLPIERSEEALVEEALAIDSIIEIKPFVLEGSVESFDPTQRAKEIAKKLSRKWCGTYSSFNDGSNVDVTMQLSDVKAIGQMVVIGGEMLIGNFKTKFRGNLNAKSNQTQLIILSDESAAEMI